ncbi:MAG TPA: LysR family transcriptional regulator [Brevibacterium sp.]|nr:LysR family transcriptional regulator [Brevibacterium sp.]
MSTSVTQYLYLQTAIEKGSLRAAAGVLGVSQPTLSIQIRKLEEELNVLLLKRTATGVGPTPEAVQLLPLIDKVIRAQAALVRRAAELRSPTTGTVKVGVISHFNYYVAPQILSEVQTTYPLATFEIIESGSVKIMDLVLSGELDVGLIARTPDIPEVPEGIRFVDLAAGRLNVCLSGDDPLTASDTVPMDALRGRSFVAHSPQTTMGAIFEHYRAPYELTAVTFTDSGPSTPRLVASTHSPAFATSSDFRVASENLDVVYRPLTDPPTMVILSAVLRSGEQSTTLVRALTQELRRRRKESQWPPGFAAV